MTAKKTGGARKSAKKGTKAKKGATPKEPKSTASGPVDLKDGTVLPKGAAMGTETATGQALVNEVKEIPQGADRGSTREIDGGAPESDLNGGAEPRGKQTEPAIWTKNGSIPPGTVPSPSGPMPVAAVVATQEEADKKLEEHKSLIESQFKNTSVRLSEETIGRMSRPELAAVAHDRGYDMPEAGARVSRTAFKRAQDDDEYAVDPEEKLK